MCEWLCNSTVLWGFFVILFWFLFCFGVTGFELSVLCLLGRCSSIWIPIQSSFYLNYFSDRISLFAQAGLGPQSFYLCFPHSWDYIVPHHGLADLLRWSLTKFVPRLASNCDLLHFYFLRNWNYRWAPPCLAQNVVFYKAITICLWQNMYIYICIYIYVYMYNKAINYHSILSPQYSLISCTKMRNYNFMSPLTCTWIYTGWIINSCYYLTNVDYVQST
jgi:hypothetical protein